MSENLNSDPSFRGYRKGGIYAEKLKEGIQAGAEKTRAEWAEELHTTSMKISQSLTKLRKNGFLFYPVGSKTGVKGEGGKIKDILKDQENIRQTVNRHDLVYLAPQLESISRIIEKSVEKYPKLAPIFQGFLLDKATRLSVIKDNINGNRKLTDSKNKA